MPKSSGAISHARFAGSGSAGPQMLNSQHRSAVEQDIVNDNTNEIAKSRTPPGGDRALYSIGDLAHAFEVTTRTIRFYESKGLLSPCRVGGSRAFSRRDRARLGLILRGKRLGFSLDEIAEYLDLYDADPDQRAQIAHLQEKVQMSLKRLYGQRDDLERSITELEEIDRACQEALAQGST